MLQFLLDSRTAAGGPATRWRLDQDVLRTTLTVGDKIISTLVNSDLISKEGQGNNNGFNITSKGMELWQKMKYQNDKIINYNSLKGIDFSLKKR